MDFAEKEMNKLFKYLENISSEEYEELYESTKMRFEKVNPVPCKDIEERAHVVGRRT